MPISHTIKTFAALTKYVAAFMMTNGLRLLFIVGDPGGSKSWTIKKQIKAGKHKYLKTARLTSFQLYKLMYEYRDQAIILDDVEDALKRDDTRKLLMQACETDDKARKVGWLGTESRLTYKQGKKTVQVPKEFKISSRVCLVCNDWAILTSKFGALLDRGIVIFFEPSSEEIHNYVSGWFTDKEILDFIGENLAKISTHSIRFYVNALDLKKHNLDWKAALTESWSTDRAQPSAEEVFKQVILNPQLASDIDRAAEFERLTGLKRRSFFNYKKRHKEEPVAQKATAT
ncbi:MAG: hypothetical protein K8U57_35235 [Planctomycetes bacterium]|nr:hypothetical protein [Planctomycetota bacterium]